MKLANVFCSVIAALLLMASPAMAREQSPEAKSGQPDINAALTQWKEAVESGSLKDVLKLYDKKAIMISTFAQNPLTTREELTAYYKRVLPNPDIKVEIEETHPRSYGNVAINSGRYTLSYTQDGEPVVIPARFSFTYILRDGKWIIVDHHSSRVPLADEGK